MAFLISLVLVDDPFDCAVFLRRPSICTVFFSSLLTSLLVSDDDDDDDDDETRRVLLFIADLGVDCCIHNPTKTESQKGQLYESTATIT